MVSFDAENEGLLAEKNELSKVGEKLTHTVYKDTQTGNGCVTLVLCILTAARKLKYRCCFGVW